MCVLILVGTWCYRLHGFGIPRFKLDDICNNADLIVVADVKQVRDLGLGKPLQFRNEMLQAEEYSAELSVRRALKGPMLNEITVSYALPRTSVGYRGIERGIRLVFLRLDKNEYRLADPYYSNFPATLEIPGENTASQGALELVLSNMLAVLASTSTSSSEKYEILRVDYALPRDEETVAALRKGLNASIDRELSEKIQGELIRFGDLTQLSAAGNLLVGNSATENGRNWLLYVIGNEVRDPHAIAGLKALLSSSDDSIREAAVEALWHIASPVAIPALAQKLEDRDEKVRFYAVRGLSDIANEYGWGGPTESEFQQHQQKYIAHWEAWVTTGDIPK